MKANYLLPICALALLLGACSSPRVVIVHEPNPEQPPTHIPLQSEANVIIPGQTKAYPVARYVDPSNPRIMHERHVIYRREEDDRWRLAANARQQILIGNLASDSKQQRRTTPYAQELPDLLRRNSEAARNLNQAIENQSRQTAGVLESIQNLGRGMQGLNDRVGVLEKEVRNPNYRPPQTPAPQATVPPKYQPTPQATPSSSASPSQSPNTDVDNEGRFKGQ
jgi:hypothetical protein